MKAAHNPSLIGRLLWSLCIMQVVVLITAIAGTLYHIIDDQFTFMDDAVIEALEESISVQPEGLVFASNESLRKLQATNPGLWVVIADGNGRRKELGSVPGEYRELANYLPVLGISQIRTLPQHRQLTMRIEVKEIQGQRVHIMVGGVADLTFTSLIVQATGLLSPYFLTPLLLFTLLATPIVVLRAMRSVRRLAGRAAALDISQPDAHLPEDSVPREIRPLVSAFNAAMERSSKAYHARDRFLRDAAHELRMPIAVLMARLDGIPAHPIKTMLQIDLARLATVAEQLLDLQRLQTPKLEFAPVDLVALGREVISDIAPLALARCDDLVLEAPEQPVWVMGQASALSRVITNLLQNALVHGAGVGTIGLRIGVDGSVAVADQGPGVTPQDREQIFQPFYRGKTEQPGHGLGLHLVQEIVRAHDGRITVEDAEGGGALFRVQLPLLER